MERRGMNSPIQGMGSDFGFIGSNEYTRAIDQFITDNGIQSNAEWFKDKGYYDSPLTSKAFLDNPAFAPIGVNSMVHDSIKTQVRYDLIYIALHLKEWAMIRGVREYVKDRYGFNFNVDLAIEFEVGCSSDTMTKWLFNNQTVEVEIDGKTETAYCMRDIVRSALQRQRDEFGMDIYVDAILKEASQNYKRYAEYLHTNFPLAYQR
jgi:hypothetical protein